MNNFKNLELVGASICSSISLILFIVALYTKNKIRLASIIAVLLLIAAVVFAFAYAKSVKNE